MHYSVNDNARHDTILAENTVDLVDGFRATLLAALWTDDGSTPSEATFQFNFNAQNNETITIGDQVYTFKDTLTGAYQVKTAPTNAECCSNLWDAVTDNSANEGVTYGTGTAEHPTIDAEILTDTRQIRFFAKTGGPAVFATAETIYNGGWLDGSPFSRYGGWKLKSGVN